MKINDKKGMFSKAIEDSAYKGTLQLHVEGVGDGVAPIRQSLTQVSAPEMVVQKDKSTFATIHL